VGTSPARKPSRNQNQLRNFEEPEQKIGRYVKQQRQITALRLAKASTGNNRHNFKGERQPLSVKFFLGASQWSEQRLPIYFTTLSLI
jgi:hypothetical protein